jgi:putative metal-binding protein
LLFCALLHPALATAAAERCAPGYAFQVSSGECIACNQPCKTGESGVCGRGIIDCSDGKPVCRSAIKPGERLEICNGEDDDCDGTIDDGFDKDHDGYTTCSGDCDDRNISIHPDAVERCDAKDNNCNGLIDDGFNIGGVCSVGLGECARQGHRRCKKSRLGAECDILPDKPTAEICDSLDNNCDGRIDEGLGEVACGVGACRRFVSACNGGNAPECVPGKPTKELCGDGVDNDCDGTIDEGFAELDRTCSMGVGACKKMGKILCNESKLGLECSAIAGTPIAEICGNRIDDDCDGVVDSDTPNLGKICSNELLGECQREGKLICNSREGALLCNAPTVKSKIERCDGLDNDCDGMIDNDVIRTAKCGKGVCAGGIRSRACSEGEWGVWGECSTSGNAIEEICGNSMDDDCDGVVDVDAPGLKEECDNGLKGACFKKGELVCTGSSGKLTCSAGPIEKSVEICNGVDDDCDGVVDEGVTNACGGCGDLPHELKSTCQVAGGDECALGSWVCKNEAVGEMVCALDTKISDGVACSSDDNICTADECKFGSCTHEPVKNGISCDDGNSCTVGDMCSSGICVGGGAIRCNDSNICTDDACDPIHGCYYVAIGAGVENTCGGCEVLRSPPGLSCEVGARKGVCRRGSYRCQPDGAIACVQESFENEDVCNGIDDNCDGAIDEGLGESTCGIGGCKVTIANCVDGKTTSCMPSDPIPESCSNMKSDDDCNGIIDDVASLGQECPVAIGTCIVPGSQRCVGDAQSPICVPTNPRYAEDADGNGIIDYCDPGSTVAETVEGDVGYALAGGVRAAGSSRLYEQFKSRAVMMPWKKIGDVDVIAPDSPDQAMLLVTGIAGEKGGIAALRAKSIASSGSFSFRSCSVPVDRAPEKLLVAGYIADAIATTPQGYVRYPKIASQIPSPLAGNYACNLKGDMLLEFADRPWIKARAVGSCKINRIDDIVLIDDQPLTFAGAVVCDIPSGTFWKRKGSGVGVDLIREGADGKITHEFVQFLQGRGEVRNVKLVPLGNVLEAGLFVVANVDGVNHVGTCRHDADKWKCESSLADLIKSPVVFARFVDVGSKRSLFIIASDGAAFEAVIDVSSGGVTLKPAGGIPGRSKEGSISEVLVYSTDIGGSTTLLAARDNYMTAAVIREDGAGELMVRAVPGERFVPSSTVDDIYPGEKFSFGRPHVMALLPLKSYGGRDMFASFEILGNRGSIGEMGFIYWNANEGPEGSIADISFDGRRGRAKLAFNDPTADPLTYRASIRAHHGGMLDNWVDGFERGWLRFSVKGDSSSVGLWPIEITVVASDPGGLAAQSKIVLARDGTVEAISESTENSH